VTTATVSRAFEHPIRVERHDGRWTARAARRPLAADRAYRPLAEGVA
jgi:iron complex transport system ATP-binding protein